MRYVSLHKRTKMMPSKTFISQTVNILILNLLLSTDIYYLLLTSATSFCSSQLNL